MKPIRQFDERGRLVAAGYEWPEVFMPVAVIALVLMAVGIYALTAFINNKVPSPDRALGFILLSGLPLGAYLLLFHRYRKRSLIFTLRGEMLMPNGVPNYPFHKAIDGVIDNIKTIELFQEESDGEEKNTEYKVALYSRGGDIVRLTNGMSREQAHKIVAQLNNALATIRRDGGKPPARN